MSGLDDYDDANWRLNQRLERDEEIEPSCYRRRQVRRFPISLAFRNKTPAMNVATPREIVGVEGS